jgi:hypothetical protein
MTILTGMREHHGVADVVEEGCFAFSYIATGSNTHRDAVADADVLSAIVTAMTLYRNNDAAEIYDLGAEALLESTRNSGANNATISYIRLAAVVIAVIEAPSPFPADDELYMSLMEDTFSSEDSTCTTLLITSLSNLRRIVIAERRHGTRTFLDRLASVSPVHANAVLKMELAVDRPGNVSELCLRPGLVVHRGMSSAFKATPPPYIADLRSRAAISKELALQDSQSATQTRTRCEATRTRCEAKNHQEALRVAEAAAVISQARCLTDSAAVKSAVNLHGAMNIITRLVTDEGGRDTAMGLLGPILDYLYGCKG